jgi:ABC-type nitrate/sulfonate/bicarbonate transport system substrate-binding protein
MSAINEDSVHHSAYCSASSDLLPAQQKFLMGYSSFSANQTPIWVAKEEGFFKAFGTDPDLILIEGGTRGAQALISGDLPIMGMSGQPVISAARAAPIWS